jgi:hypothetical protein
MAFHAISWHRQEDGRASEAGKVSMYGNHMKGLKLAAVALATIMLGACGGGIPGLGGGEATQPGGGGGNALSNLVLYGGTTVPPSQAPRDEREYTCPSINVLDGAAAWRQGRADGGASGVTFQASLGDIARECAFMGSQVSIRVGVEGRALIGSAGRAGTYQVPVRVVVKRRQDIVTQRFARVPVTIPAGDSQADFAHVEERIVLPITQFDPGDEYDIYVGFDATGAQAQRQVRRR